MLRWIRSIFSKPSAADLATSGESDGAVNFGLDDEGYRMNEDILDGVQFAATLQTRTPLWILERHGEVFKGPPSQAPAYGTQADGIWVFNMRGDFDFLSKAQTHSSDAGAVNPDEYLPFLKAFRRIVEGDGSHEEQLDALEALPKVSPLFARFWRTLQANYSDFPRSFFYMKFTTLDGVARTTAKRLYEAGYRSLDEVHAASDDQLMAVHGVGNGLVAKIRGSDPILGAPPA